MSQRLSEYFSQEATDYLDQLEQLLAAEPAPDPDHLLRLARGVRGSAQMADASTVASVAERLEDAVRSLLSHNVVWSDDFRDLAAQTVRDLKVLIRALNRWGPDEEARVRAAIERWDDLGAAVPDEAAVPIASLFYDDAGPHVLSSPDGASGDEVVPVEALLFRGEAALREALRIRGEVEQLLDREGVASDHLAERVREVFELVELGLAAQGAPA